MLVLGIDTSGAGLAVVLSRDGVVVSAGNAEGGPLGAPRLGALLDALFREAGIAPSALDAVAACTGPGPFTALRAGLGAAAGLALSTGRPPCGVPTHQALRAEAGSGVLPVLDAGRGEVWWPIDPEGATGRLQTPEDLATSLAGEGADRPPLVGSGAERYRKRIEERLGPGVVRRLPPTAAAAGATRIAGRLVEAGRCWPLRPLYARPPDAVPTGRRGS